MNNVITSIQRVFKKTEAGYSRHHFNDWWQYVSNLEYMIAFILFSFVQPLPVNAQTDTGWNTSFELHHTITISPDDVAAEISCPYPDSKLPLERYYLSDYMSSESGSGSGDGLGSGSGFKPCPNRISGADNCRYDDQRVVSLDWSSSGNLLAVGLEVINNKPSWCRRDIFAGSIRIYDFSTGEPHLLHEIFTGDKVTKATFDPSGRFLAVSVVRHDLTFFETEAWTVIQRIPETSDHRIRDIDFYHPDKLVAGGRDDSVRAYNITNGQVLTEIRPLDTPENRPNDVISVSVNPEKTLLAVAQIIEDRANNQLRNLHIYDLQTGEYIRALQTPTAERWVPYQPVVVTDVRVSKLTFSPIAGRQRMGVLGTIPNAIQDPGAGLTPPIVPAKHYVRIYDFHPDRNWNYREFQGSNCPFYDVVYHPTETFMVVAGESLYNSGTGRCEKGQIRIYEVGTNHVSDPRETIFMNSRVQSLAISSDGTLLAAGEHNSTVSIFYIRNPPEVVTLPPTPPEVVTLPPTRETTISTVSEMGTTEGSVTESNTTSGATIIGQETTLFLLLAILTII